MTQTVMQALAALVILVGSVFSVLAAVGMLRLPEVYTRLHAASKAGVVGAGLVLAGVALASLDWPVALRAALGIIFLLLTTPISAHVLARAAYLTGAPLLPKTNIDDAPRKDVL